MDFEKENANNDSSLKSLKQKIGMKESGVRTSMLFSLQNFLKRSFRNLSFILKGILTFLELYLLSVD